MGWVVNVTSLPLYPRKRDPLPIVQEARWAPKAGLGERGKSRPPPGLDSRTVEAVARRYADCAVPVHVQ
jgi:hypothetical protein